MKIPFANRTVDVDLPYVDGQPRVTVKGVMDEFLKQMPENFNTLLEAFVLLSPRRVRITCRTSHAMEEFCHSGLAFRDSPIVIRPCKSAKWVNLTRLSYGVPAEVVSEALQPYGKVIQVKMDSYHGVHVGIRNILMEITTPIPSRLQVAGHWCNIFYPGQVPTCFTCHQPGQANKDCPARAGRRNLATASLPRESVVSRHAVDSAPRNLATMSSRLPGGSRLVHPKKVGENSKSYVAAATSSDEGSAEEDDDEFVDVPEYPDPPLNKRSHSDDDLSDHSTGHDGKKGKVADDLPTVSRSLTITIPAGIPTSPNLFEALPVEPANVPLPDDDVDDLDDSAAIPGVVCEQVAVPPAVVLTPVMSVNLDTPLSTPVPPAGPVDYDGDDDSSDGSLSPLLDSKMDNPLDPDKDDGITRSVTDKKTLDSPLTPITPNVPRIPEDSQPSSYDIDPFTLAVTSKKTKPAPLVGSGKNSRSIGNVPL